MKRVLHYKSTDDGYGCFENDKLVFEIKKADLQFNVKDFYRAFYGEGKDYTDISVINDDSEDKESSRIFMCIDTLVKQIGEKLAEMQNIEEVLDEESEDGGICSGLEIVEHMVGELINLT